jgi:hypothetical protein
MPGAAFNAGLGASLADIYPQMIERKKMQQEYGLKSRQLDIEEQRNQEAAQNRALQLALLQANRDEVDKQRQERQDTTFSENLAPGLYDQNSPTIKRVNNAGFGGTLTPQISLPAQRMAGSTPDASKDILSSLGSTQSVPQLAMPQTAGAAPQVPTGLTNFAGTASTQQRLANEHDRQKQNEFMDNFRNTQLGQQGDLGWARVANQLAQINQPRMQPFQPMGPDNKPLPQIANYNDKSGGISFTNLPSNIADLWKVGQTATAGRNQGLYKDQAAARSLTDIDSTLQEALRLRSMLEKSGLQTNNDPLKTGTANFLATSLGIDPTDMQAYNKALQSGDAVQAAGFVQGMATKAMLQGSGARGQIIQQTLGKHIVDPKFSLRQTHQVLNDMIREYINLRENTQRKAGVDYSKDPFMQTYDANGVMAPSMTPVDYQTFRSYGIPTQKKVINPNNVIPQ